MSKSWFNDARFGIFIHWGPYAVHGRCVWASYRERMALSEYEGYARRFTASEYRPDEWVDMAWNAGARYMVLCTRQHPGYALFDSRVSEFTAAKGTPGRDLVAEYVEACRRKGMRIGFYYSLLDWRYPAYFNGPEKDPQGWSELRAYVHAQVLELMSNYGKIDVLWYDGRWPYTAEDWRSSELNAEVRRLQPDILINNRSGLAEDFGTPEQQIPGKPDLGAMWESCMTMNEHWGYSPGDLNWKTPRQLIHMLVKCACLGGNLLLDVGPKPDGTFPEEAVERLEIIGQWMAKNGESIYGAGWTPLNERDHGVTHIHNLLGLTGAAGMKGRTLYLHIYCWQGSELPVGNLKTPVLSARLLATGEKVDFHQKDDRLILQNLPEKAPDPYDTVIALELDGQPERYPDFRPFV
jgi:alpha-L-fucosidase